MFLCCSGPTVVSILRLAESVRDIPHTGQTSKRTFHHHFQEIPASSLCCLGMVMKSSCECLDHSFPCHT